ncbi:HD domain protein [Phycisphaerae bacterium RAS1]|nr:HD domain protein [Phycisphaerae bacterium RAS1]
MTPDRVLSAARDLLTVAGQGFKDPFLYEHSLRVMRLAQRLAVLPEYQGRLGDPAALELAALFHDAGWALQFGQGRVDRWQLLNRPTSDVQRELGAVVMLERVGDLVPSRTARLAAEAIRQCNDRGATLAEARVLADAESLDEIGLMYLLRQFRFYQADGRSIEQLLTTWQRQREYRYWDARLQDGFRSDAAREIARRRVTEVESFIAALSREHGGEDVVPG